MKREELLKKIEALPEGTEVCIMDWQKNAYHATGDEEGNGEGIYPEFNVEMIGKDGLPEGKEPFAVLSFNNDDYEEGGLIEDLKSRLITAR